MNCRRQRLVLACAWIAVALGGCFGKELMSAGPTQEDIWSRGSEALDAEHPTSTITRAARNRTVRVTDGSCQ